MSNINRPTIPDTYEKLSEQCASDNKNKTTTTTDGKLLELKKADDFHHPLEQEITKIAILSNN